MMFEQLVRNEKTSTRNSEDDHETGKSLPFLPLFRGLAARSQEVAHAKLESPTSVDEFVQLLPGNDEGYDEGYRAAMELVLPLNKQLEPTPFHEDWSEARHNLRRESLGGIRA